MTCCFSSIIFGDFFSINFGPQIMGRPVDHTIENLPRISLVVAGTEGNGSYRPLLAPYIVQLTLLFMAL
ncbi:MAG: hypothetical protein DMG69_14620 [Acidobacteria bacterium]|nr:MAG: hypothetical protein DMG69_14620 [Acidobacteriota bacterium]